MNRTFAYILTLAILLTSVVFPVHGIALDINAGKSVHRGLTYEELLEKAECAFPENSVNTVTYDLTKTISNPDALGSIVTTETRRISETELISYSEYTSGYSLYTYQVDVLQNSTSSGSGYSLADVDIYVYSPVLSGMLQVYNFSYSLAQNNYDSIISTGRLGTNIIQSYLGRYKLREDASGSAYALYTGVLENTILSSNVTITLEVNVGNDSCTHEVYG